MHNKKAYAEHITTVREFLMKSAGLSVLEFPSEFDETSEFARMGPLPPDNFVLKSLAETIGVALQAYTDIQVDLGLWPEHEPRFARCSCCRNLVAPEATSKATTKKKGKP